MKISALEDGSGLVLGGQAGYKGYTQLLSRGPDPLIKLLSGDGKREQTIRP